MTPKVIAFGHAAQSGKGAACEHALKLYKGSNILKTSFARALRSEIHHAVHQLAADEFIPTREAMEMLCYREGAEYDPFPIRSPLYSLGKQRALLQAWGMRKRAISPTYWVDKVAHEIEVKKPDIVVIDDLRFLSEAEWVKSVGGVTVHVHRSSKPGLTGEAATHISEHELSSYEFDHVLENDGTLKELRSKVRDLFLKISQPSLL